MEEYGHIREGETPEIVGVRLATFVDTPAPPVTRGFAAAASPAPIAKRRRDLSFYTEVTYWAEGKFVRIKAKRYAEFKQFTSPLELLVGPGPGGPWLIFEQLAENRSGAPPAAPKPK